MRLFYDMLTKGVTQILGDRNSKVSQWLKVLLLSTTSESSFTQVTDSKWSDLSLTTVNFKDIFDK